MVLGRQKNFRCPNFENINFGLKVSIKTEQQEIKLTQENHTTILKSFKTQQHQLSGSSITRRHQSVAAS